EINLEDRLLGSDDKLTGRPTRQYKIGDLVDFISSSTNTDGLAYKFSSGSVNKNTFGYFHTDNDIIREVTEIYLNNITKDGINTEQLFAVMKEDDTPIYFKLADSKDPSKIAYFTIVSIEKEPQNAYYKFNVALMNTLGYGKLVDLSDYYFSLNVTSEF